ncbi:trimeric intracellular cation channel family protein [Steroidobacter cummioxidans]|uniref:trimeric intracellular cation channel family protein n=1 Tax=Steroidobacter cummioxidans TaxID=1803913 RepID=UPI000E31B106|nr:trimeric intracellular cation channel family protein [Steroidobacter cummioxidans]
MKTLILVLDLAGTFVFALAGATAGARRQLDIFGILVLAFAAACSGGIARDVLMGATPPAAITDWRYLATSVVAGIIAFRWHAAIERMANPVRMFDAAGLALFAVTGAQKALAFELNPVMAALFGMLTGIGGGVVRDLLLAQIPLVLRAELYAVAALGGATVVVLGDQLGVPPLPTALGGAAFCFVVRVLAIKRGWQLPKAFQQPPQK